jgi:hypothetical protein
LYVSENIIRVIKSRRIRWARHAAHIGEMRNAYNTLVGKPEGKRAFGRLGLRWEDSIRMDLRGEVWEGVDCVHLAQDKDQWRVLANTVMNNRIP